MHSERNDLPQTIGKYRIQSVLGKGAMGVVYKGLDPDIERTVAIKVMLPHLEDHDGADDLRRRFRIEAQAAARCFHPNIVTVFDLGRTGERDFIVMEFVEGDELKYFISRGYGFSHAESVYIVIEVLKALDAAHRHGIVHRDIKPGNIILLRSGGVKVADFGVARMDQSELTMTGHMVGTPVYMSPEGLRGQAVDHRADIYSTGMVLLELLTGKKPLPQQIYADQLIEFLDQTFASETGREVGSGLREVVYRALAPQARHRFGDAHAFQAALEQVLQREQQERTAAETLAATVAEFRPLRADNQSQLATGTFHWTPELLHKLEHELATYTGPVANFLIKRASSASQSPNQLVDSLARHIPNDGERERFLAKARHCMDTGSCHGTGSANTAHHSASGGKIPLADTLTPDQTNRLIRALATHVGPLARQLVAMHARRSYELQDLYEQLAGSIPDHKERREFLHEISRQ